MSEWDFHFEKTGLGVTEGANIPSAEFFTTKDFEDHLVREMIQNSIDARAGEEPVRVEFETMTVHTDDLPGISTLRGAVARAETQTVGDEGHGDLVRAAMAAHQPTVQVLRIGDYGTRGLTGSESREDPKSPLSTLTRGVGVSSNNGGRGGSFGIGSAVAMVGSAMRTVAYVSLPHDAAEQVFTMTARLASFRDETGVDRAATGFYIRNHQDDFEYRRDAERHAPFRARTEPGTDTYVLGYLPQDVPQSLTTIRNAVVRNFFVAVLEGDLVVSMMGAGASLVVDADTVRGVIQEDEELSREVGPFIRAYDTEADCIVRDTLVHTGSCELRIRFDSDLRGKSATMLMRGPKMLITTYKPQVPYRYAAVFICRDAHGNAVLRHTEPAQHDKWSMRGVRGNHRAVSEIQGFIRRILQEKAPEALPDSTTVEGLARLLPKLSDVGSGSGSGPSEHGPVDPGAAPDATAGGARRPLHEEPEAVGVATNKPVAVAVTSPATAGKGDRLGSTGRGNKPLSRTKQDGGSGGSTEAGEPEGASRRLRRVRMKSFVAAGTGTTTVVLASDSDQHGDLALRAQGLDGALTTPDILAATQIDADGTTRQLEVVDGSIKDIVVAAGERARLQVSFAGDRNYRLTAQEA